jgi:hypothetical protein
VTILAEPNAMRRSGQLPYPQVAYTHAGQTLILPPSQDAPDPDVGSRLWIGRPTTHPETSYSTPEPIAYRLDQPGVPRYWILLTMRAAWEFEVRFHGEPGDTAFVSDRSGRRTELSWPVGRRDDGRPVRAFFRDAPTALAKGYVEVLVRHAGSRQLLAIYYGSSPNWFVASGLVGAEVSVHAHPYRQTHLDPTIDVSEQRSPTTFEALSEITGWSIPQIQHLIVDDAINAEPRAAELALDTLERYILHRTVAAGGAGRYDAGETLQRWRRRRVQAVEHLHRATRHADAGGADIALPERWLASMDVRLALLDPALHEAAAAIAAKHSEPSRGSEKSEMDGGLPASAPDAPSQRAERLSTTASEVTPTADVASVREAERSATGRTRAAPTSLGRTDEATDPNWWRCWTTDFDNTWKRDLRRTLAEHGAIRRDERLSTLAEAVSLVARRGIKDPGRHLPVVARILDEISIRLEALGQDDDAARYRKEAAHLANECQRRGWPHKDNTASPG